MAYQTLFTFNKIQSQIQSNPVKSENLSYLNSIMIKCI